MARRARKAIKIKDPKAFFIALVAVILIIAIAVLLLRFAFPDVWNRLVHGDDAPAANDLPEGVYASVVPWKAGLMQVHYVDIGQGDFIYIQFPDGADMVIDCGSTKRSANGDPGLSMADKAIAYLNEFSPDGEITHLMLTHTDQDHVSYLDEVIEAFEVKNIYLPNILANPEGTSAKAQELKDEISRLDGDKLALFTDEDAVTTQVYAEFFVAALTEPDCAIHINMDDDEDTNDIVIAADGYTFTFYCPTRAYYEADNGVGRKDALSLNAVSPVGILSYAGRRLVFTGDSNELNEPIITRRIGNMDCDVLKVAHHGSATSSSAEFLAAVSCEYAVISCGKDNSYRHPTTAALNRMRDMQYLFRTDLNGTVVLTVDSAGAMSFFAEIKAERAALYTGQDA